MSVSAPSPLSLWLVPDEMWDEARRLIPPPRVRPQGGGRVRVDDRMALVAMVYVLTQPCAWRRLPPEFGMTVPSVYRRFVLFAEIGFFRDLFAAMSDPSLRLWTAKICLAAQARAGQELDLTVVATIRALSKDGNGDQTPSDRCATAIAPAGGDAAYS